MSEDNKKIHNLTISVSADELTRALMDAVSNVMETKGYHPLSCLMGSQAPFILEKVKDGRLLFSCKVTTYNKPLSDFERLMHGDHYGTSLADIS